MPGRHATIRVFSLAAMLAAPLAHAQAGRETLPLGAPGADGSIEGLGPSAPGSVTTIASLMAVVGLIIVCGAVYKWMATKAGGLAGQVGAGGKSPAGILSVLGRYPLGRGQTLLLLQVDRRILLLCQSASGKFGRTLTTTTLSEIAHPDEVASIIAKAKGEGAGFEDMLTGYEQATGEAPDMEGEVEVVDLTTRRRGGKLAAMLTGKSA